MFKCLQSFLEHRYIKRQHQTLNADHIQCQFSEPLYDNRICLPLTQIKHTFALHFMLKIMDNSIHMIFIAHYNGLEPIMGHTLNVRSGFKIELQFRFSKKQEGVAWPKKSNLRKIRRPSEKSSKMSVNDVCFMYIH